MLTIVRESARVALAVIRLFNGTLALFAPQIIIRRFADDPDNERSPVAEYALRMFGIRTILVALDLLLPGEQRSHAIRVAPIIHVSDLITAILVSRSKSVSPKTKLMIVSISGINTVLALLLSRPARPLDHALQPATAKSA